MICPHKDDPQAIIPGEPCQVDVLHHGAVSKKVTAQDRTSFPEGTRVTAMFFCSPHNSVYGWQVYSEDGWKHCKCRMCQGARKDKAEQHRQEDMDELAKTEPQQTSLAERKQT